MKESEIEENEVGEGQVEGSEVGESEVAKSETEESGTEESNHFEELHFLFLLNCPLSKGVTISTTLLGRKLILFFSFNILPSK